MPQEVESGNAMPSNRSVKTWMTEISDEDLERLLASTTDIDLILLAIGELLREADDASDLDIYREGILRAFRVLVIRTARLVPRDEMNARLRVEAYLRDAFGDTEVRRKWIWPVVNQNLGEQGAFGGTFREVSALKMFGYTVGATNGWEEERRQHFLSDFMEMELPAEVYEEFGDEYGGPLSATRLRKVANVIASNCSNFYRRDPIRYRQACQDWEDDLEFLRLKYYEGAGLMFEPWPDSRSE